MKKLSLTEHIKNVICLPPISTVPERIQDIVYLKIYEVLLTKIGATISPELISQILKELRGEK